MSSRRNAHIELLRFVFCIVIINYHFFSHCLRYLDIPNFFCRGYLGDEYFFIISGVFLSKAAATTKEDKGIVFLQNNVKQRIRKIAIPYYFTWILCFIGHRVVNIILHIENEMIYRSLLNSTYELLFLDMFGFRKGTYSNDVAWFFSALFLSEIIISPLIKKNHKVYTLYFAPLFCFFGYGILSINYDYLHTPHDVLFNIVMKGTIRAFSGLNLGVFIHGISELVRGKGELTRYQRWLFPFRAILLIIVLVYTTFPFPSNGSELTIQWDYIVTFFIGLIILATLILPEQFSRKEQIFVKLGRVSFYVYFGQACFYSIDKWIYTSNLPLVIQYFVTIVVTSLMTAFIWKFDKCILQRRKLIDIKQ